MRALVCGSREWPSLSVEVEARDWLADRVYALPPGTVVIQGEANGADRWAGKLATRCGLFVARMEVGPQHWKRHGRKAGILRDNAMLDLLQPGDLVIVAQYAESRDTQYTVDEARRRGIEVELRCWLPVAGSVS